MLKPCGDAPPHEDYNFLLRDFMPKKRQLEYDEEDGDGLPGGQA